MSTGEGDDTLVTVRLLGLPLDIRRRTATHDDTLRRELALVQAGRDTGARLDALSSAVTKRFGGFVAEEFRRLERAGDEGTIDLTYEVPPDAAEAAEAFAALLDEIDELCRAGTLVTVSTPPDVVAYRRWLVEEFIGQIREGRPPRPWPGTDDVPTGGREHAMAATTDGGPPLLVDGDLDLFGAPSLRAAIAERFQAGADSIVIDLSRCGFVDSVGLSLLLTTRERCQAAGGSLEVIGAGEVVLRLFETVGIKELLVRTT